MVMFIVRVGSEGGGDISYSCQHFEIYFLVGGNLNREVENALRKQKHIFSEIVTTSEI